MKGRRPPSVTACTIMSASCSRSGANRRLRATSPISVRLLQGGEGRGGSAALFCAFIGRHCWQLAGRALPEGPHGKEGARQIEHKVVWLRPCAAAAVHCCCNMRIHGCPRLPHQFWQVQRLHVNIVQPAGQHRKHAWPNKHASQAIGQWWWRRCNEQQQRAAPLQGARKPPLCPMSRQPAM